jgi:hypothetical protein
MDTIIGWKSGTLTRQECHFTNKGIAEQHFTSLTNQALPNSNIDPCERKTVPQRCSSMRGEQVESFPLKLIY